MGAAVGKVFDSLSPHYSIESNKSVDNQLVSLGTIFEFSTFSILDQNLKHINQSMYRLRGQLPFFFFLNTSRAKIGAFPIF